MIEPDSFPHETERLIALRSYNILDSQPEGAYNDISTLASLICDTSLAAVSLIDEDRQFFKARIGNLPAETPRKYAFCAHTINSKGKPFIVPDATKDERFQENPFVRGQPNIVFYAGITIESVEGYPLGSVCVMDHMPRHLSDEQLAGLQCLANQVQNLLELRRLNQQGIMEKLRYIDAIENKSKRLEDIAWHQSHVIRSPVSRMIGLIELLRNSFQHSDEENTLINYLITTAEEIDAVIKNINDKTE